MLALVPMAICSPFFEKNNAATCLPLDQQYAMLAVHKLDSAQS